jgi:hypothetical protein
MYAFIGFTSMYGANTTSFATYLSIKFQGSFKEFVLPKKTIVCVCFPNFHIQETSKSKMKYFVKNSL